MGRRPNILPQECKEIRQKLLDGSTFEELATEYHLSTNSIRRIDNGLIYPGEGPMTRGQIQHEARERRRTVIYENRNTPVPANREYTHTHRLKDVNDLEWLVDKLKKSPHTLDISIVMIAKTAEELKWIIELIYASKHRLEIDLAKSTLILDAIEKNDFSDLPPSVEKELDEHITQIRKDRLQQNEVTI